MKKLRQEEKIQADGKNPDKHMDEHVEKVNIRCRKCFMVEGYFPDETACKHCGAIIYRIDVY
ncbi:MAG: hypothetical protein M1501_01810 [Candidatus Omnitrophica bacterium]|nr:hypothetical protein [Candidatus Omnitrophota bacterium]